MNETAKHIEDGRIEARRLASVLMVVGGYEDPEYLTNRLRTRATEMARGLNMNGTSLQGFLREAAVLQGFADEVESELVHQLRHGSFEPQEVQPA